MTEAEMPDSFAELLSRCPDEDLPLLRELLADDVRLPCSTQFVRGESGEFRVSYLPGPLHWTRQTEWPWVLRNGDFQKDQKVLEVSGSHSVLKFALARRVEHVTDTEFDSWYIPKIQETVDLLGCKNVELLGADSRELPFPDNWFDRVVCVSTLEHIEEGRSKAVSEMVRVLKPNGLLLLTMDVKLEGTFENDFFVDRAGLYEILQQLNVTAIVKAGDLMAGKLEEMAYTVVLIRYRKG